MLQLAGAGKRFGHKLLFDELDWLITPKERTGLVGGNGTGKSTLLKVIGGIESLDYGSVSAMKGIRLGYLPQDGLQVSGRTVFAECLSVFAGVKELEQEIEALTVRMSELDPASEEYSQVADRFERADSEFRARDGYAIEAQVGSVLSGLGFAKDDWVRQTEEFSGGWQMRIALAKLLLEKPNVLLLDEPTNHLDLEARNWLEELPGQLSEYAYVLISHDRYFLGRHRKENRRDMEQEGLRSTRATTRNIAAESRAPGTTRGGLYATSRTGSSNSRRSSIASATRQPKRSRCRAGSRNWRRLNESSYLRKKRRYIFRFRSRSRADGLWPKSKTLAKSYGSKQVLGDVNFVIERGDRIALVGVNGAGKSTLIKLLAGTESPTSGEYDWATM